MDGHEAARRDAAGIFLSFRSAEARGPLDRAPWLATLAAVVLVLSPGARSESTSPLIQTPAAFAVVVQPGGGAGGTPLTA